VIAELDKLIELQKTDTNLRRLKQSIQTSEARRAEIEQEFEQHAFSIREIQTRRDDLTAKRADLERQIAENKTYLERADRNLKHAQNSKEYETAMRETDALQKQIGAFETQVVEAMESLEGVENELEERAEEIETLDAKRAAALAEFDKILAKDKTEFAAETKHREAAFATLPARLASIYDRLAQRSRDGIAVAEVIGGACSACYMHLRPQVQLNVKKGDEIVVCENCSRIMYMPKRGAEANAT
jgi:predicted  nucleic acid-binding Zn-ribbon protein